MNIIIIGLIIFLFLCYNAKIALQKQQLKYQESQIQDLIERGIFLDNRIKTSFDALVKASKHFDKLIAATDKVSADSDRILKSTDRLLTTLENKNV